MNFWQKLWAMAKGTANDAVDAAVDPGVMMRQGIRELEDNIKDFEKALIDVTSNRNMVQKQYDAAFKEVQEWEELAAKALSNGNEADATEALTRADNAQQQVDQLKATLDTINTNLSQLKTRLEELRVQKTKAESEVKTLEARTKAADATIAVQSTITGVGDTSMGDMMELARKKADEKEAQAQAVTEIGTKPVDDLKSRINGGASNTNDRVKARLEQIRAENERRQEEERRRKRNTDDDIVNPAVVSSVAVMASDSSSSSSRSHSSSSSNDYGSSSSSSDGGSSSSGD